MCLNFYDKLSVDHSKLTRTFCPLSAEKGPVDFPTISKCDAYDLQDTTTIKTQTEQLFLGKSCEIGKVHHNATKKNENLHFQ